MRDLERALGYAFKDKGLMETALTHSSYANENKRGHVECNERLEFLGDSILGAAVAERLYGSAPQMAEGDMTRRRAALVCEKSLFDVAERLGLGEHIVLGRGEESSGGRGRHSILADAVEALLAAMYLDGGWAPVKMFVDRYILRGSGGEDTQTGDYKTALQEFVQRKGGQSLIYHLTDETGPEHDKIFAVEVRLNGETIGAGTGRSKKIAEQNSAREAMGRLKRGAGNGRA
ncbi:MAG: ribonuclease III [Oscillospiraceae bacterium]|jgi:ribonuclease-3|nr:ribonuclease III [Oscillospiraceae bacterium]